MNILFISRKKPTDMGGLSRFTQELTSRFPKPNYLWTSSEFFGFFKIPFRKIDLIHLSDATLFPLGVLIKTIIHKPLVVTAHGLDLAYPNIIYQAMLHLTTPRAHAFILDSSPIKKLLTPFPIRIDQISIINPGISIEHLKKSEVIQLPINNGKTVLVTVGNLVPRKGHLWFIRNVLTKLNRKFVYLIVGDGPERNKIKLQINKLQMNDRVFLLGQLSNPQLTYVLRNSDIYVCPNRKDKGNFEGFGIAVGEAAAIGLPVVASQVDGIPEIINDNKNGWLIDPDPKAFFSTINKVNRMKNIMKFRKSASTFTQKNYSWDKTVKKYVKLFQEVVDKTNKSHLRSQPK